MNALTNHERRQEAREARVRWEEAIAAGRDHHTIGRMWESYEALANLAGVFAELEHEAAEREPVSVIEDSTANGFDPTAYGDGAR